MSNQKIKNRKVFYISGFDPRGSRFYRRLYNDEALKQAGLKKYNISVGRSEKESKLLSKWNIEFESEEENSITNTEYNFLHWDDIIRENWISEPLEMAYKTIKCYMLYVLHPNAIRAFIKIRHRLFSFFYPLIFILLNALVSCILAKKLAFGYVAAEVIIFLICFAYILRLGVRLKIFWLMRIYIFCQNYLDKDDNLDERLDKLTESIHEKIKVDDSDEILIVGHSVGTLLAASLVSRLISKYGNLSKKVKLVTLGHCLPLVTFSNNGKKLKEEIRSLADKKFKWLDVASPSDGASFAFTSPFINVCANRSVDLKMISPRFHMMFEPAKYRKMKLNTYRMHFQYIMASERVVDYDYFEMTSGNKSLDRFFANE